MAILNFFISFEEENPVKCQKEQIRVFFSNPFGYAQGATPLHHTFLHFVQDDACMVPCGFPSVTLSGYSFADSGRRLPSSPRRLLVRSKSVTRRNIRGKI
jgi:hypothetical protein